MVSLATKSNWNKHETQHYTPSICAAATKSSTTLNAFWPSYVHDGTNSNKTPFSGRDVDRQRKFVRHSYHWRLPGIAWRFTCNSFEVLFFVLFKDKVAWAPATMDGQSARLRGGHWVIEVDAGMVTQLRPFSPGIIQPPPRLLYVSFATGWGRYDTQQFLFCTCGKLIFHFWLRLRFSSIFVGERLFFPRIACILEQNNLSINLSCSVLYAVRGVMQKWMWAKCFSFRASGRMFYQGTVQVQMS